MLYNPVQLLSRLLCKPLLLCFVFVNSLPISLSCCWLVVLVSCLHVTVFHSICWPAKQIVGGPQDKRVRLAEAVQALADAKTEAAQVIATAAKVKNDVPEAIAILSTEFTKDPMKLSGDDMQKAIDCLRNPDNATLFVTLSKQPEMKEHRERWLERTTGIYFFNENSQFGDVQ